MTAILEIRNLHVEVEDQPILKGLDLTVNPGEVHAIMGPNGSGKSTLAYVLAGKDDYEVTEGQVLFNGEDLLEMAPDERAAAGVFLAFQYPVEIPGVATMTFLQTALNAQRKARGEDELSTPDFMRKVREAAGRLSFDMDMLKRPLNVGFSGGEKKRAEILQMALLEPKLCVLDETDSRPRHRCAEDRVGRRQCPARARSRDAGDHPLPAPPQPHRPRRRACALRWPHRRDRRKGTGARAREAGLRRLHGSRLRRKETI